MKKNIISVLVLSISFFCCTSYGMYEDKKGNAELLKQAIIAFQVSGYEVKKFDENTVGVFGSFEQGHEAMLGKVAEVVQSLHHNDGNIIVIPNEPGDGSVRYRNLQSGDDASWVKNKKEIVWSPQDNADLCVASSRLCIYNVHSSLQFRRDIDFNDKLALEHPLDYFITDNKNTLPVLIVADTNSALCLTGSDERVELLVALKNKTIQKNEFIKAFEKSQQFNSNDNESIKPYISVWKRLEIKMPLTAFLVMLAMAASNFLLRI